MSKSDDSPRGESAAPLLPAAALSRSWALGGAAALALVLPQLAACGDRADA